MREAPLAENAGISVVRLSPALAGDFLALFDRAFPDNPDWSGCYCRFYHSAERPWDSTPAAAARHRAEAAEAIAAGLQTGVLAYATEGDADAWAMCFVIDPAWRGRGVAGALLEGALAALRSDGLRTIEAWPRAARPDDPASFTAGSCKGPHGALRMRAEL